MWLETKKRFELSISERKSRSSSEQSSQDCGYSSEHNISSSSLPSTPEGSEVACSEGCCNHERDCHDVRPSDKLVHSSSSISLLKERGGGLTLTQMLEVGVLVCLLQACPEMYTSISMSNTVWLLPGFLFIR